MIQPFNDDIDIIIPKDPVDFACTYFIKLAKEAIDERGVFTVALSGGSTPKALYNKLKAHAKDLDWGNVLLFFSDERATPPTDPDSNYHMAMTNGFNDLPVAKHHIFRMKAETDIEKGALAYEKNIKEHVPEESFDLVLLGMGDDGHTASLFPGTKALNELKRYVVENEVPQKNTWRMTFTYPLIRKARNIMFLATGAGKAEMIKKVLTDDKGTYPAAQVRSDLCKVLWVLDKDSSDLI